MIKLTQDDFQKLQLSHGPRINARYVTVTEEELLEGNIKEFLRESSSSNAYITLVHFKLSNKNYRIVCWSDKYGKSEKFTLNQLLLLFNAQGKEVYDAGKNLAAYILLP